MVIAIFAYGSRVDSALEAGKALGGSVIDMRFVKPLDEQLISQIANSKRIKVTKIWSCTANLECRTSNPLLRSGRTSLFLAVLG
jgi:pyruvate/2-oxoglutarate/acetoin dehydrogenase E1 component